MRCLPVEQANKLKEAARRGEIDLKELIGKSREDIAKSFSKYLDSESADFISRGLDRARKDDTGQALTRFVEKNFKDKSRANQIKNELMDVIENNGKLSDAEFEILAQEKYGIRLQPSQANKIVELSTELDRAYEASGRLDNPLQNPKETLDYFKKKTELDKFVLSLNPSPGLQVASSIWGRSAMLTGLASPVTNIISNTVRGAQISIAKRIQHLALRQTNTKTIKDYVKLATKIYKETGYDLTRMESLDEGRLILREKQTIHAEGKGVGRAASRVIQDWAMNKLMGLPDVVAAAMQRADTTSLLATRKALSEGLTGDAMKLRAKALMEDALSLKPSDEVLDIRRLGIQDAAEATWTNKGWGSNTALSIRKFINGLPIAKELRLGDANIPFAKTPGNVIAAQLEDAGLGNLAGIFDILSGAKLNNKVRISEGIRKITKSGIAVGAAAVVAAYLKPTDYIGSYEQSTPSERKLVQLKDGAYNSVKIGGTWVSLDYFGSFGGLIAGIAQAQKTGSAIRGTVEAGQRVLDIPGLQEATGLYRDLEQLLSTKDEEDVESFINDRVDAMAGFISSRSVPRILTQIEEIVYRDKTKPDYDILLERVAYQIPVIRKLYLDPSKNIFGETLKTQSPLFVLFFGARLKQAVDDRAVEELDLLYRAGALPAISNIATASSRFKTFKTQVSKDKFNQALQWFSENYKDDVLKEIKKSSYKKKEPADKKKAIDAIRSDLMDKTLRKFGYKNPKKS